MWDFLVVDANLVLQVAKLAGPDLVLALHLEFTELVKDALAACAEERIASSHLSLVLEALETDLCDIRVKLLSELAHLLFRLGSAHLLLVLSEITTCIAFLVTQVQLTLEVVLVQRARRIVPRHVLLMREIVK